MQLGQFISTAIFLLSNRLHDFGDGDQGLELLCSLFDRAPSLTTTLLRNHVPSIRAAWESLLEFSTTKRRRDMFRVLIDIGIQNHWLTSCRVEDCLLIAVKMDCYDVATKIAVYFRDHDSSPWWYFSLRAIMAACRKGNVEFASLLIQLCDVNAHLMGPAGGNNTRCGSMFLQLVFSSYYKCNNHGESLAVELFLNHGASVDNYTAGFHSAPTCTRLVRRYRIDNATRPTVLDHAFYFNRRLFDKLAPYSTVPASRITRTRLLVALENGTQTLTRYLSALQLLTPSFDQQHVQSLLELLLVEQFEVPAKVDLRIIRSLFEYGVDSELPSIRLHIRHVLHRRSPAFAWHQFATAHDRMELLDLLLMRGGVVGERILAEAIAQYGTCGLESLTTRSTEFATKAVRALTKAAGSNNFEAVESLFRKGVDPHAFITTESGSYSIQALAISAPYSTRDGGCSVEMMQLLASHGARLVVTTKDSTPFEFANRLLRKGICVTLAKMKYVLGTLMEGKTSLTLPADLLESCFAWHWSADVGNVTELRQERLRIYEYLYKQGAEVSPGPHLAALVNAGGREELVRQVLASGSDINAYFFDNRAGYTPLQAAASHGNETLICLFLQQGADVNSPPRGLHGYTALQGLCLWSPATEEEHRRKIRICSLLINQEADVNAAPARRGCTALAAAATRGDLELAVLLLREAADVNAPSWWLGGTVTALDVVATHGRLDMVKFLLNANALSGDRGVSGYDGAIFRAESWGQLAVAGLIREHAAKVATGTVFNPELWKSPTQTTNIDQVVAIDLLETATLQTWGIWTNKD